MADQGKRIYRVDMQPVGRRIEVAAGETLLQAAQTAGVELIAICGGEGICNECRVRLVSGKLTPPSLIETEVFSAEELEHGFRLACQSEPLSDVKIEIPPESLTAPQRLQVEGEGLEIAPRPLVSYCDLILTPPSLADLRADIVRIEDGLREAGKAPVSFGLPLLSELPNQLRELEWKVRLAMREGEAVGLLPIGAELYGLAVDVGTTKVAAYLVNLQTGKTAGKAGAMNPQIAFGEDVVSRIAYANQGAEALGRLQSRLAETLNSLLGDLCANAGVRTGQVVDAVVVGNTAMHHLFAKIPARSLGHAPYTPVASDPLYLPADQLGLKLAPGARVYLPANIAGYVGADHVSMLLATGAWRGPRDAGRGTAVLALDIGTNTEISLATRERVYSCSCASGPAFEGAHIRDGMRAAPGAIERVQRISGDWRFATIGNQPPVGICGSGILDAIAEMVSDGAIDHRGVMQSGHPRVRMGEKGGAFVLATAEETETGREILITRRDVNEIQLAKGAIRGGIEVLLRAAGVASSDLEEIIIAGAFGTYIDVANSIKVGMFPALPLERFHQVGNAAGEGARRMLLSSDQRQLTQEFIGRVEYIELTATSEFTGAFMKAIGFPQDQE